MTSPTGKVLFERWTSLCEMDIRMCCDLQQIMDRSWWQDQIKMMKVTKERAIAILRHSIANSEEECMLRILQDNDTNR